MENLELAGPSLPAGHADMDTAPLVSVLMPTYEQAHFIRRALESLCAQTLQNWELIIVDDGSQDATGQQVAPYLADARIRYCRLDRNRGLGAALNHALAEARAPLVAYLPSDDVYWADHLATLADQLDREPDAILAYSGVRREVRVPGAGVVAVHTSVGQIEGYPLQLVQAMHRLTVDRWVERDELVTDDLERMFWAKLRSRGAFVGTSQVSSEWTDHPLQRHKVLQEPRGGLNPYRARYQVQQPLRFHSTRGSYIDEVATYARFRERPAPTAAPDGLKILLVGELAFNPERILAFEERGHQLYGLWTPDGHWYNSVGPLPFGHVIDLPQASWREAVREIRPDVIYALLNWVSVPFVHQVFRENPGIPFVWHFKEGPYDCIANGTWPQLVELCTRTDGQVYSSPEMAAWLQASVPDLESEGRYLVLDGDLPKRDWFDGPTASQRSATAGQVHTVVAGNPVGITPAMVGQLARADIHLHFYGDLHHRFHTDWIAESRELAPDHLHLHKQVRPEEWRAELSQYDAGWLHVFKSHNAGDLHRATWDDLNYPARIAVLLGAGLPLIQYDNGEAVVATQSLARERDIGLFFTDISDLAEQLHDRPRLARLRENVWRQREEFTFDYHVDRLIAFFRQAIAWRSRGWA
jgi:hypothetical protein